MTQKTRPLILKMSRSGRRLVASPKVETARSRWAPRRFYSPNGAKTPMGLIYRRNPCSDIAPVPITLVHGHETRRVNQKRAASSRKSMCEQQISLCACATNKNNMATIIKAQCSSGMRPMRTRNNAWVRLGQLDAKNIIRRT